MRSLDKRNRWRTIAAMIALVATMTIGCRPKAAPRNEYNIGDKVPLGSLTYTVLQSEWRSQLGTVPTVRMPQSGFLLIRISVTNGGGKEVGIPLLNLENSSGDSFTELADGQGVDGWF